ncbi:HAMP domain-containing sensor histidine kinase [Paenibacillus sp. D2_2]|uniref:HAMP domain-containing sensor histidine kinase n=1 Tax=Paenibacillus sp. D2_2 TaxID=3073092 RepID=UPI002815D2F0|nr:HAMP domain-containing sensor histidine kinase [Paenibacillus sp. D2_2]WMT42090.1 HAMP domain-containing sensor histidine kinase [Paenibacillus sp. D2_2]
MDQTIDEWQVLWMDHFDPEMTTEQLENEKGWIHVRADDKTLKRPEGAVAQWVKIKIPAISKESSLLFKKIYGYDIIVKQGDHKIYESHRKYKYAVNVVLLPSDRLDKGETVYLGIQTPNRIGIQSGVYVGDFYNLHNMYVKSSLSDFIIGSSLMFIAFTMLICAVFLNAEYASTWVALCLVILSCGFIMITYSSFLYSTYGEYGKVYVTLFDLSLYILLPAFTYFFEKVIGNGYKSVVVKFRMFQFYYSLICIVLLVINLLTHNQIYGLYRYMSSTPLGLIMIFQFILLIAVAITYAVKGNKEAQIFSIGFAIFAGLSLIELIWFYLKEGYYDLFLWKWGVVSFLLSLIVIMGKRFARNHEQIVEYSKQLEMFNNELQRSEKMEIISELAASVAHEVRNPLQVTRGFLQLLSEKNTSSNQLYLNMALDELDRAASIITDFLTFAKPEAGKITTLNVLEEFIHIEGILIPLVNLQGGKVTVHIPSELYIKGSSSKFKQAFINIIKNSIEALHGEGEIEIWAHGDMEQVNIYIKDNGEGMDPEVLARLGEPYFSNKTKGTGLGLMVTFRIIEVMKGEISFTSTKGVGTEVRVCFPTAIKS